MRRAVYFPSSCQKQTTEVFEILPLHPRPPPAISPISGPIAQLDRVPDYESGGRGFESSSVRHLDLIKNAIFGSKLQITLSILTEALIVPQWIADHYADQIYSLYVQS